jgi:hypothetical protein
MNTVPASVIEQAWERISNASPKQSKTLAQHMQEQQPSVMVYLLAVDENLFDAEERGTLLMLGALIWQAMSAASPVLPQITPDELDEAETANLDMLEELEEGSEMDYMETLRRLTTNYNQMPLLASVMEALMEGHEDTPELAPDHLGMALIYLKTVIDCLDRSDDTSGSG